MGGQQPQYARIHDHWAEGEGGMFWEAGEPCRLNPKLNPTLPKIHIADAAFIVLPVGSCAHIGCWPSQGMFLQNDGKRLLQFSKPALQCCNQAFDFPSVTRWRLELPFLQNQVLFCRLSLHRSTPETLTVPWRRPKPAPPLPRL